MALQDALLSLWDRLTAAFRTAASGAAVAYPATAPAAALRQQPRAVSASPNDVFTPTRPRAGRKTLVGRQVELGRILDGLLDDNAHVVLYSERGRGKTSLSNLTMEQLRRRGVIVARCACEAETAFDTMVRALVRDLPASLLLSGPADEAGEGCEGMLPHRAIRPADVAAIPESLASDRTVFVVDEFDRVLDLETRTRLADTIKLLSDRGSKLSFMVVGVSDTLEQIIGQHPSIQRNIVGVHLPLLAPDEIETMLVRGGQQAGIAFTPLAVRIVRGVARGMPYMAQLLGLRIAQAALRRAEMGDGPVPVEPADIKVAVDRLVDEASSGVVATYNALVAGAAEPRVGQVLTRLARRPAGQVGPDGRGPRRPAGDRRQLPAVRCAVATFARHGRSGPAERRCRDRPVQRPRADLPCAAAGGAAGAGGRAGGWRACFGRRARGGWRLLVRSGAPRRRAGPCLGKLSRFG